VWTVYLIVLLLSFTFAMPQTLDWALRYNTPQTQNLEVLVLQNTQAQAVLAAIAAVLTAMAMYSYLYNSRLCGMMNSLPLRRETMFGTAYVTGLAPLLLAQLLAALLTALVCMEYKLPFVCFLKWLGIVVLSTVAFYGFAVFCAVLTGNILVLPVLYVVLNLTATVAELCVRGVLFGLCYGSAANGGSYLLFLSPLAYMVRAFSVYTGASGETVVTGLGMLAAYGVAGLLLTAAALRILRRRHMECAGDVVAVPVLKPAFRYCMAFGTAFVLPVAISELLNLRLRGPALALVLLAMLLLGAFLGWYIAEMLIRRSLRVFFSRWKGLCAVLAVLLVFFCAAEFDLFGYERRVPAPGEVKSVTVNRGDFLERENIEAAVALHRSFVEHKSLHDNGGLRFQGFVIQISYELNNGRHMERVYSVEVDPESDAGMDEDLRRFQDLCNTREAIDRRVALSLPLEEKYVTEATIFCSLADGNGYRSDETLRLTPAQAVSFYRDGILADAAEGKIGLYYVSENQPGALTPSNVQFSFGMEELPDRQYGLPPAFAHDYRWFQIYMESEHCLAWLKENTAVGDWICPAPELEARAAAVG